MLSQRFSIYGEHKKKSTVKCFEEFEKWRKCFYNYRYNTYLRTITLDEFERPELHLSKC